MADGPLARVVTIWDAVVAGAGPAGSMAAHALARGGARVLLVDRRPFPRWKVCGACLGPGAQQVLRAAGLEALPERLGARRLDALALSAAGRTARVPLGRTLSLSREALDSALTAAACRAGAVFRSRARATLTERDREHWRLRVGEPGTEREVAARLVIDATGLAGTLGEPAHARSRARRSSRVGVGAVFPPGAADVSSGALHMIVGRNGYVGLVRLEDDRVCVAAAVDAGALAGRTPAEVVADILRREGEPALVTEPVRGWRGTPPLTRSRPATSLSGVYLVGDAASYVEPFTGEGMGWALADGAAAAAFALRALEGDPDAGARCWAAARQARAAHATRLCRGLARGLRRPWLVRPSLEVLRVLPGLARPLVRRASRVPALPIPATA